MTDANRIENELKRATRFTRLVHAVSCSSTQDLALADALATPGEAQDAVFWTDHQDRGRGRQQREWHDEPGTDLLVTFRARIPRAGTVGLPSRMPAALPAAILRAIEPFGKHRLRVKWPNDIFHDGRKLAGMLIDSGVAGTDTYLIGVGINCNRVRFPPDLEVLATSLALMTGEDTNRGELLLALARSLDAAMTALVDGRHGELLELFRDRLDLLGREVEVTANATERGVLTAIDFDRLQLDGDRVLPLGFVRGIRAAD
ncbi:MAG: biotin--[acetyl-CoA-carboxylase] ligase [bacterium]|nr:biotin--[acetyl-CoA-carboxylase] ligase [bacterium]